MRKRNQQALAAAVAGIGLGLFVQSFAHGATVTWNGGGGTANWSEGANWGGPAPVADDSLVFAGANKPANTNDFPAGTAFAGITFNAGAAAFTLGGNGLTLSGGAVGGPTVGNFNGHGITNGVTNNSSNLQTVSTPVALAVGNHTFGGGAGGLLIGGPLARNAGGVALFTPGAGGVRLTATPLTNGILGGWALAGTNWATLGAGDQVVAYAGYTDVVAGGVIPNSAAANVRITAPGAAVTLATAGGVTDVNTIQYDGGATAQTIDVGAGNTLRLGASGGILRTGGNANAAVIIGSAVDSGVLTAGGADNTAGEIVLATNVSANTNTVITVNSTITDNGSGAVRVVKTGQAAATLNGNNTYTGGTFISEGRLQITGNTNAAGTGPITVVGLGQAFMGGGTYENEWFVAGIGTNEAGGHGAIRLSNGTVLNGTINLVGNARLATRGATGGVISGKIVGPHTLEIGGYNNDADGTTTISNTNNAWLGGLVIAEDVVMKLGASEVIPHGPGFGNVALNVSADGDRVTILDLNGFNERINGLSRTGATAARAFIRNNGAAAATLTVGDNNQTSTFDGTIQDGASLVGVTKVGGGTLTLSGTNTYTGGTAVDAGTLVVTGGGLAATGNVVVNASATEAGTLAGAAPVGNLTLAANAGANAARVSPGAAPGAIGTLAAEALTVNGGEFRMDLSPTVGTGDLVAVTGAVAVTAPFTIVPVGGAVGQYTLVTSGAGPITYAPGATPTVVSNARPGTYAVDTASDPAAIKLTVNAVFKTLTWTGATNSSWDNATFNWTDGVVAERFFDSDQVVFGNGPANRNVVLTGTLLPGAITVDNALGNDYTFGGAGSIASGVLTKRGAGTLVVAANNTFGGGTVIEAGVVQIGGGGAAGSLGGGAVTNGGTLVFNRSDAHTFANVISGAGDVRQVGPGVVILSGASTYTGPTTVTNGATIRVTNALNTGGVVTSSLGGVEGTVTVHPGSAIDLSGNTTANQLNFGQKPFVISGSGPAGAGAIINNGVAQQNAFQRVTLAGPTQFNNNQRFDIRAPQVGGVNTGLLDLQGHTLTKNGPGQFTLVAVDVTDGEIVINGGTFAFETTTVLTGTSRVTFNDGTTSQLFSNTNPVSTITRPMTFNGAVRVGTNSNNNTSYLGSDILLNGNVTVGINNSAASVFTHTGTITETGGPRTLTKTNLSVANLQGANTYSGATTINGGTVNVSILANGGLASGIGSSGPAPAFLVLTGGGTLGYTGSNAASTDRQFTLGGSAGLNASGAEGAPVTFAGTAAIPVTAAGAVTLTLGGTNADANALAGRLQNGAGAAVLSVTKVGAGSWALGNANTYTGATAVNEGTLRVTGSASNSASVTVAANATFEAASVQSVRELVVNGLTRVASGSLKVGTGATAGPLTISGGKIDLTSRGMAIDFAAGSEAAVLGQVRNDVITGRNAPAPGENGDWGGNGITSSTAATNTSAAVGYALASEALAPAGGTFLGQQVDGDTALVRYTLAGDATLDGAVNFNDLVRLAQNYNTDVSATTESWWFNGDFTYDGLVNFNDLVKLAQNYNTALPAAGSIPGAPAAFGNDLAAAFAAVPEPGTLGGVLMVASGALARRRRRDRA